MITLLPFDKTGYNQLIAWVTNEEMLMQFAGPGFHFPLTAEQIKQSLLDKKRIAYKILHVADQKIIGHAEIVYQDGSSALLSSIFIGDLAYREKGLAQPLMNKLLNIAFGNPAIEEVSLNVFDWNVPAIKSYKKAGLQVNEGKTLTRHVKDKTWIALNMILNRKTYEDLQKRI
ncbi:MAG TPA: GNAT family protein [Chitinophagaceae bacterium]|nr:GNAT family protein [Chitinophagaceae bacterium]